MPLPLADLTTGVGAVTLTSDERDYVREVLGISLKSTDSKYRAAETRFDGFASYQNRSVRYWLQKYDDIGDSEISIDAEGASLSKAKKRERVARALYNIVFADGNVTPLDNIDVQKFEENRPKVSFVRINIDETESSGDEYGG